MRRFTVQETGLDPRARFVISFFFLKFCAYDTFQRCLSFCLKTFFCNNFNQITYFEPFGKSFTCIISQNNEKKWWLDADTPILHNNTHRSFCSSLCFKNNLGHISFTVEFLPELITHLCDFFHFHDLKILVRFFCMLECRVYKNPVSNSSFQMKIFPLDKFHLTIISRWVVLWMCVGAEGNFMFPFAKNHFSSICLCLIGKYTIWLRNIYISNIFSIIHCISRPK